MFFIRLIFIVSFTLFNIIGYSQDKYVISGNVLDQNLDSLEYGDVIVRDFKDSTLVQFTYVDSGYFRLDPINEGIYQIEIICLGFKTFSMVTTLNQDTMLNLQLSAAATMLDAVEVTSTKNMITSQHGNLKIDVGNSILSSQANIMDMLSLLPKLQVSTDGESITIIGKGSPLIYLGNQQISMDHLRSIPLEDIQEVEIINNPSAKYEATGRSVLLITLKKKRSDGIKASVTENLSRRRRTNNYAGLNTSLKTKALEIRANLNYNQLNHWESNTSQFELLDQNAFTEYLAFAIGDRTQFIYGGGFYYQFDDGSYLSANANLRAQKDLIPVNTNSTIQLDNEVDIVDTYLDQLGHRNYITSNLNYNKDLKKIRGNLFIGTQYSGFQNDLTGDIFNNINDTELIPAQYRRQDYQIGVFAARVDFEKKISDKHSAETGFSFTDANAQALIDFEFFDPIANLKSDYDYQENYYAGYIQSTGQLNPLTYSAGIRIESNHIKSGFANVDTLLVSSGQTTFFPKLSISIPFNENKSIAFNYGKTISRPGYRDASSITVFINPLVEFSGNVGLRPAITQEASLVLQLINQSFTLSYVNRDNPIFLSVDYNDDQTSVIMSLQNFNKESGFNLEWTSPINYKFWTVTNTVSVFLNKIEDDNGVYFDAKPFLYYYSNHRFKLSSTANIGLNFWGMTKRYLGIFERNPLFTLNGSFSKTLFEKFTFTLNLNDVFRGLNYEEIYTINRIGSQSTFFADAQAVSISLRYTFGKEWKSAYKNKDVDDNLNRIK